MLEECQRIACRWTSDLVAYVGGSGTLLYLASSLLEAIVAGFWRSSRWVDVVLQRTRRRCESVQGVESGKEDWSKVCVEVFVVVGRGSRLYEELSG